MFLPAGSSLNIALAGFGTVGAGVQQILKTHGALLEQRAGRKLVLRRIAVRDPQKNRHCPLPTELLAEGLVVNELCQLADDPDIHVVVEVIGGTDAAHALVTRALRAGKHVVSANKALLAEHGDSLFQLARENGRLLKFEAAVAGGIPLISTLQKGLAGNQILAIRGILNGTTNLILSSMQHDGSTFEAALREAKRLGFAEADPTFDVSGADSAQKLAILTHVALGSRVTWRAIPRVGIDHVTQYDIAMALSRGFAIRLMASAALDKGGGATMSVAPTLVPSHSEWGQCIGGNNVVEVLCDSLGPLFVRGLGAGALPTASAIVADLIEIATGRGSAGPEPITGWSPLRPSTILPSTPVQTYFLRWLVLDRDNMANCATAVTAALKSAGVHGSMADTSMGEIPEPGIAVWLPSPVDEVQIRSICSEMARQYPQQGSFAAFPILHV